MKVRHDAPRSSRRKKIKRMETGNTKGHTVKELSQF